MLIGIISIIIHVDEDIEDVDSPATTVVDCLHPSHPPRLTEPTTLPDIGMPGEELEDEEQQSLFTDTHGVHVTIPKVCTCNCQYRLQMGGHGYYYARPRIRYACMFFLQN